MKYQKQNTCKVLIQNFAGAKIDRFYVFYIHQHQILSKKIHFDKNKKN